MVEDERRLNLEQVSRKDQEAESEAKWLNNPFT